MFQEKELRSLEILVSSDGRILLIDVTDVVLVVEQIDGPCPEIFEKLTCKHTLRYTRIGHSMRPSFSTRFYLIGCIGIAAVMVAIVIWNRFQDQVADGYRLHSAVTLLIDFVESKGTWPRDWGDLELFVQEGDTIASTEFNTIRDRIVIEFDVKLGNRDLRSHLGETSTLPSKLILHAPYGAWSQPFRDPNICIQEYLLSRSSTMFDLSAENQTIRTNGTEISVSIENRRVVVQATATHKIELPIDDVVRFQVVQWQDKSGIGIVLECSKPGSRFFSYRWATVCIGKDDHQQPMLKTHGSIIENTEKLELAPVGFQEDVLFIALKDPFKIQGSNRHLVLFYVYSGTESEPNRSSLQRYFMLPREILTLKQSQPWAVVDQSINALSPP